MWLIGAKRGLICSLRKTVTSCAWRALPVPLGIVMTFKHGLQTKQRRRRESLCDLDRFLILASLDINIISTSPPHQSTDSILCHALCSPGAQRMRFGFQYLLLICPNTGCRALLMLTLRSRSGSPTLAEQNINHGAISTSRCKANYKSVVDEPGVIPVDLEMPRHCNTTLV